MASFFSSLFGGGGTQEGAEKGAAARTAALGGAQQYLEGQTDKAAGFYGQGQGRYDAVGANANAGDKAYADAMGLNGPEGLARAKTAFSTMPGYGGALSSSNDEIARYQALTGNLGSSNTSQQISDNTANVINQKYGQYTSSLAPYLQQAKGVADARAGLDVGQGGLYTGLGNTVGQWQLGTANANAQSYLDAGKAQDQGVRNLFDTITGGLKLAGGVAAPKLV
jgi:hypothetical protein